MLVQTTWLSAPESQPHTSSSRRSVEYTRLGERMNSSMSLNSLLFSRTLSAP